MKGGCFYRHPPSFLQVEPLKNQPLMKSPQPPSKQPDRSGLSLLELIDALIAAAHEEGASLQAAKSGATNLATGKPVYDPAKMGRHFKARKEVSEIKLLVSARVGGLKLSPEVTNASTFRYLAWLRSTASCNCCGLKPPRGRGMSLWSRDAKDSTPLPLMMAWGGASIDKVKSILDSCEWVCRLCARKRGYHLLFNGNPDLKQYQVEVI